jgi:dihydrofolate reductase
MKIRTHIGMSLDGFVTDAAGLPAWDYAPTFTGAGHGYPEFMAGVGAIAMGGTSFNQGFKDWLSSWPWPGKPVLVLTSRPIPADAPEAVVAVPSPEELIAQLRATDIEGDVQLLGGPSTIAAVTAAGGLDELGVVVLPVLLGSGIPLFEGTPLSFSQERWAASQASGDKAPRPLYELLRQEAFPDGSVHLVYRPPA